MRVLAVNAPPHFRGLLSEAPADLAWLPRLAAFDCAVAFATSVSDLRRSFSRLEPKLAQDGMIWIAWPKKASGVQTDLNENIVRDIGLDVGLVDIKVCAIDATWSGLKFVRPAFAGTTGWAVVVSSRFSPAPPTARATQLRGGRAAR